MKYVKSILLKFLIVSVILEIVFLLITGLTFGQILFLAAAVTIITYFVGDLLVLSVSNNATATIANLALSFFTIYMFNFWIIYSTITFTYALIASIALAIGEWFFHKYMLKAVYPKVGRERK